ncbi:MAG: TIGR03435 family protein [Bryobacteraceae bacterium]
MRLLLFAAFTVAASAQPAFEVASIRLAPCPCRVLHSFRPSGAAVTFEGYTWIDLVTEAYNLKVHEVSVPDALEKAFNFDIFYNIQAKAEGDAPRTVAEFRAMLQSLLAERFHLKFHRETKEMQVYALVIAKDGIQFKESDPDVPRKANVTVNGRNQKMTATHMTMDTLSTNLYIRPVVDRTGLKGEYDIVLEATPEFRINNNPQPEDISIFTAIQSLGLKLEPTRASVEILVVDSIEKPSEN